MEVDEALREEGCWGRIRGMNENKIENWNARRWAVSFRIAAEKLAQAKAAHRRDWDADQAVHQLRADVFRDTAARVQAGGYVLPGGVRVDLSPSPELWPGARFYDAELPPGPDAPPDAPSSPVEVVAGDCLAVARRLVEAGESGVCVLDMASAKTPGGGVYSGAGAQEEHLFRSSDCFRSFYRFADFGADWGVPRAPRSYPLRGDFAGVFAPGVTVFRGPEAEGYPLLERPWRCAFLAVPALSHPDTAPGPDGLPRLVPEAAESTCRRIRTILRIARENGQRALVLSAFGCGAFRNPPRHVAELFRDVLAEPEFRAAFALVVFAIVDDHNAPSGGNLAPFRDVFAGASARPAAAPAPDAPVLSDADRAALLALLPDGWSVRRSGARLFFSPGV